MSDARQWAPAVARNRDAILAVLEAAFPSEGLVLEIASGTGEHAVHFAHALPGLQFATSDPSAEARQSIEAWCAHESLSNLRPPIELDVQSEEWPIEEPLDAMLCCNMIHIAPWAATLGLLAGAGRRLRPGAPLVLYGPYKRGGVHTAPSNAAFDDSLQARDPSWGVRDFDDVLREAAACQLQFDRDIEMPANNLCLVLRRA